MVAQLQAPSLRALRIIRKRGIVRGKEIAAELDTWEPERLWQALEPLVQERLITVEGPTEGEEIFRSLISFKPSRAKYIDSQM